MIKDLDDLITRITSLITDQYQIFFLLVRLLNKHKTDNNLNSDSRYGYKKGHSTETLLLKVMNDLLINCDNHILSIMTLLDLSAAFDTVDQEKLI